MKKYCLIGNPLKHSYSALVHSSFNCEYKLVPLENNELENFVYNNDVDAFNVTIPYKKDIMKYLHYIDDNAKLIGAVNTVVKRENKLFGYNTDIDGFLYMLKRKRIILSGKKVLIFGGGGTGVMAKFACELEKAREIIIVKRDGNDNYDNLHKHYDSEILINATPIGMYPKNNEYITKLDNFKFLEGVVDAIYNPINTNLILDANRLGIKNTSGLLMLVMQARYAQEHFTGKVISDAIINDIYLNLYKDIINIALIGMPSSGKTTIGKIIAQNLGKKFVDTDLEIEKIENKKIADIFKDSGEAYFRRLEKEIVEKLAKEKGQVLSLGGGGIFFENAYNVIKQNSIIIHLKRDLEKTDFKGRPLLKDKNELIKLYQKRIPVYTSFMDIEIENNKDEHEVANNIIEKFNIYVKENS